MIVGYMVRINWSQTDQDTVFVEGAKSQQEAIDRVRKGCNCPRIYGDGAVDYIYKMGRNYHFCDNP